MLCKPVISATTTHPGHASGDRVIDCMQMSKNSCGPNKTLFTKVSGNLDSACSAQFAGLCLKQQETANLDHGLGIS